MANGIKNSGGKISVKMGLVLVMVVLIEVIELDGVGGGWMVCQITCIGVH